MQKHTIKALFRDFPNAQFVSDEMSNHSIEICFEQNEKNLFDIKIISVNIINDSLILLDPLSLIHMCTGYVHFGFIKKEYLNDVKEALCVPNEYCIKLVFNNLPLEHSIALKYSFKLSQFFKYDIYIDDINVEFIDCGIKNEYLYKELDNVKEKFKKYLVDEENYDLIQKNNKAYQSLKKQLKDLNYDI